MHVHLGVGMRLVPLLMLVACEPALPDAQRTPPPPRFTVDLTLDDPTAGANTILRARVPSVVQQAWAWSAERSGDQPCAPAGWCLDLGPSTALGRTSPVSGELAWPVRLPSGSSVVLQMVGRAGTRYGVSEPVTVPLGGCAVDRWRPADFSTVYEVGPGRALAHPNDVPWESIGAGTLVRIWPGASPYRAKWVINASGTASSPIVVMGVCDPVTGALPIIDGDGATTRVALDYWSEGRGVIKIGGASVPSGSAAYIHVEDLDIRGARPPSSFSDDRGNAASYGSNGAAIFVESGSHITLRGNRLSDSGNGLFVASQSSDVLVSSNILEGNGIVGSFYEHNSYTEALGITFEYNQYGPLCAGCGGNNLKDRSAGTVIRYNRIDGGNRQLDLVDSGHAHLRNAPSYAETFVYGNVLVERDGDGNSQVVHYGGDSGNVANYRQGTLWFFHNTVWSERNSNTTLMRLSAPGHEARVVNSVVHALGPLAMSAGDGDLMVEDSWLTAGWSDSFSPLVGSVAAMDVVTGGDPGLQVDSLAPMAGSDVIDGGRVVAVGGHGVDREFSSEGGRSRPSDGVPDMGAFEYRP